MRGHYHGMGFRSAHTLEEVQKLYGKLLHASLAQPAFLAESLVHAVSQALVHSDASSAISIGARQWRAWRLPPGCRVEERDIGWAEALAFELLIHTVLPTSNTSDYLLITGAWSKGDGKEGVETIKRILSSDEYTTSSPLTDALLSLATLQKSG